MDTTKMIAAAVLVGALGAALYFKEPLAEPPPAPPASQDATGAGDAQDYTGGVTELKIEDLTQGTGETARAGDALTMNYRGTLVNGQEFDSSFRPGSAPFGFQLGAGQVIRGWDQGIEGMRVGGRRRLTIPPELGYGSQGSGTIPPNATLIFEVELLDIAR